MTTKPISLAGHFEIRVDCQCNAYSHETVRIPFAIAYEALLAAAPADPAILKFDRRITAVKAGGIEVERPTKDFTPVHMAQAIQTMRNQRWIPFSPLVTPGAFEQYKTRPAYHAWKAAYDAALADQGSISAEGTGQPMAAITADPDGTWVELVDDEGGDLLPAAESAVELARAFPLDGSVDAILDWIDEGDNVQQRAAYALALEQQRRRPRGSLRDRIATLWPASAGEDE